MSVSSVTNSYSSLYNTIAQPEKSTSTAAGSAAEDTEISKEQIADLVSKNQSSFAEGLLNGFAAANPTSGKTDLFSSLADSFSTLELMKSGAYSKLINKYYASQNSEANAEEQLKALKSVNNSAIELKDTAFALSNTSLYENAEKTDDKMLSAAKKFISAYNQVIDDAAKVNDVKVLQKGVSMVKMTDVMSEQLSNIGITVNKDNTLSIDERVFSSADINTVKSLFSGENSYAARVSQKAAMLASNASVAGYNANGGYNYTAATAGILNAQV